MSWLLIDTTCANATSLCVGPYTITLMPLDACPRFAYEDFRPYGGWQQQIDVQVRRGWLAFSLSWGREPEASRAARIRLLNFYGPR